MEITNSNSPLLGRLKSLYEGERLLVRRLMNILHLLTGNFTSSFLGLIGFTLTARALGPTDYGLLALSFAYARGIERIVSFRSWQPLIKYGANKLAPDDHADLKALLKFGLLLDISAAVVAWLVAIAIAVVAGHTFGIPHGATTTVILYSCVLPFQFSGMSTAVLRLFGRYNVMAYGQVFSSSLRVLCCLYGAWAGWGLAEFLLIWMGFQIVGPLNMTFLAFMELRRRSIKGVLTTPLRGVSKRFPGLFKFSMSSNLSLTIRSSAYEFDTLIVGYLTDPASAGLYHIAKRIGGIAQSVGGQVQAVMFPDLARSWTTGAIKEFRKAVFQAQLLLLSFGVATVTLVYFAIDPLLRLTAGVRFLAAGPLVVVQTLAVMMVLCGAILYSALLSMGRERFVLRNVLLATLVFHATAFTLIPYIGPMGANFAHIAMSLFSLSGMTWLYRRSLAKSAGGSQEAILQDPPLAAGMDGQNA